MLLLSLKSPKKQPLHLPFLALHVLCFFHLRRQLFNILSYYLINNSHNSIHVLKSWIFYTWHYLGHLFPSSLYSCNMCHMSICYICLLSHPMSFYGTRYPVPGKTYKFRLPRNSNKFNIVAKFHETIPTVKSVSSSEI